MHPTRILRTTGFRLSALYAGLFGLSVLVLFGVIYWVTSGALRNQLADTVEGEVAALVEDHQAGGVARLTAVIDQRLASNSDPAISYLLLDPEGRKLAGDMAVVTPVAGWQTLPAPPKLENADADDPEDIGSAEMLALGTELSDRSFLLVGADTHRIVEVEEVIIRAFGWALGVTVLLAVVGGLGLSLGFLRRVDAINRTTRAIIQGKLADRVPTRGTGDELDRLALNLNEMLDRMQALMESLRQVSNDIAHDLRTPLTRLRQRLEAARLQADGVADYETAVDQAISDTDAILGTFSALLRIAQIEAGTRRAAFSPVDLSAVFRRIVDAYGAVAEDRGQTLSASIEPDVHVHGDRELLTQMLANLVENGIRHTPAGTRMTLSLERRPNGPVGIVADTGAGIPTDMRDKVFQRFFRLEPSRSTAGYGLGLSLVAAVADLHGISVSLADNAPGLRVILEFSESADGWSIGKQSL